MPSIVSGQVPLLAGWVMYAVLHSILASQHMKALVARHWPSLMPWYRLAYNVFAVLALLPLAWLMWVAPGRPLWAWQGAGAWLTNGLALAAAASAVVSSRAYAMNDFLGLGPLRGAPVADHDVFRLSPLHRFVRHPWYACGLVMVWTRDMNGALLVSALAITAYLVLGSRLEERKLIALHGEVYRRYRARVPGLVPLPWKWLSRDEAERFH